MQLNKLLLLAAFALSGCATNPEPGIKVEIQEVKVPVPVACKEKTPPPPDYCLPKLNKSVDIFEKVKCILSDRKLDSAYQKELTASLNACK